MITDMSGCSMSDKFNGDISKWDVSKVTTMGICSRSDSVQWRYHGMSLPSPMNGMFEQQAFNGDISEWDVSSVSNMGPCSRSDSVQWRYFRMGCLFVTNMNFMFSWSDKFNGDIPNGMSLPSPT
jgi:surface protein